MSETANTHLGRVGWPYGGQRWPYEAAADHGQAGDWGVERRHDGACTALQGARWAGRDPRGGVGPAGSGGGRGGAPCASHRPEEAAIGEPTQLAVAVRICVAWRRKPKARLGPSGRRWVLALVSCVPSLAGTRGVRERNSRVPEPSDGRTAANAFGFPTRTRRWCEMAPPRADVGRCEAHGAHPRPPSQPAGPTGPLGSRPAHLAPWRAAQAPTPRPIRPLAGSAGLVGGRSCGHIWVLCDLPTRQRRVWAVSTPPGGPLGCRG